MSILLHHFDLHQWHGVSVSSLPLLRWFTSHLYVMHLLYVAMQRYTTCSLLRISAILLAKILWAHPLLLCGITVSSVEHLKWCSVCAVLCHRERITKPQKPCCWLKWFLEYHTYHTELCSSSYFLCIIAMKWADRSLHVLIQLGLSIFWMSAIV